MALRIALDTNRYVDFCIGDAGTISYIRRAREIFLPFIVVAELRAGFAVGIKQEKNAQTLSRFLHSPRVNILFADEQTTHHYASIYSKLRELGKPVPTNDLWIASLVVQHDLVLLSRDKHFKLIPQIPII